MTSLESFNALMGTINDFLWADWVMITLLAVGTAFLVLTRFSPLLALTHGFAVLVGRYDNKNDPGAISHFQALSAALSATVGLGNIGGVAIAIATGGPGAIFWMWVVGIVGMALKIVEVTLSMLYRDTSDPHQPKGGPMWVAKRGFAELNPAWAKLGTWVGGIFCVTLLISAVTGGNMFQVWNVAEVSFDYFGIPKMFTGIVIAVITAGVIIGGIKRIGAVAGLLVPFMCGVYLLAGLYVLALNITEIPGLFVLIFTSAFSETEATGAFLGGTVGSAFLWGMKRALFSNEAGQGSAPIAHSAAKTDEPVREGILSGLEPFIDTLVVCTITALVILASGAWNRGPEGTFTDIPTFSQNSDGRFVLEDASLPPHDGAGWKKGQSVFMLAVPAAVDPTDLRQRMRIHGQVALKQGGVAVVAWETILSEGPPTLIEPGVYGSYVGASLTAHAFDRVALGLGAWMVTLASWLFAISTIISWSYYGEQGVDYLFGEKGILPYKIIYCALAVVTTTGIVKTTVELDNLSSLGTGVMLFANIPISIIMFGVMRKAYNKYVAKLKAGEFHPHKQTLVSTHTEI